MGSDTVTVSQASQHVPSAHLPFLQTQGRSGPACSSENGSGVLTRDNQREKSWVLSRWDAVLHRLAPGGGKVGGELRTKILDSDYIRVNWGCVRSQNLSGP